MSVCAGCGSPLPPGMRKWCSERCRKAQYAGACVDCGAPTSGSDGRGPNAPRRCASCGLRMTHEAVRGRALPQRITIEAMWADGCTARQIAAEVGWNPDYAPNLIAVYRSRGYDLPVRNHGASAYLKAHPEQGRRARAHRHRTAA